MTLLLSCRVGGMGLPRKLPVAVPFVCMAGKAAEGLTKVSSRRLTAYARSSLRLPGAADARRYRLHCLQIIPQRSLPSRPRAAALGR